MNPEHEHPTEAAAVSPSPPPGAAGERPEETPGRVRRELEDRLQERTRELSRANQALLAEIARQRRTEEALRSSERRARALLEHAWEGVSLIGADGTILYTSPSVLRLLGFNADELAGRSGFDLLHPDDGERVRREFGRLVHSPGATLSIEYRHRHKDASWRWIEAAGTNRLADPDVRAIIVNQRDISERKQGEAALRRTEGLYRDVVEGSLQGIAVQQDGLLCYVNPALTRIFGYDRPDEIIGRGWEALVAPEDIPILKARSRAGLSGDSVTTLRIWQGLRKDGSRLWAESGMAIIGWQGRPAVLSFVLDVTERRHMEEQLRQAQKMEAVGRLAGGIAHDFNNLLTGILGYGDILLHDLGPTHPSHEVVQEMQKAAERAALLTNQLLAFSRKQVLAPQVLNLNTVLADMEPMLRRLLGEDVQLLTLAEADGGFVKADLGQLQQVIVNLAVNARDAMPQGGTLVLHTSTLEMKGGDLGLSPGPYVVLTVSDTGCGMTDEVRAHLFEPFFTTKERGLGTGLGLCTSYGIIKQSGGAIGVDTAPGTGTSFRICLPQVTADETPESKPAPPAGPPRGTETVLLVEDEDLVRALFLKVLKQQGYTVLPATCGEDALLQVERHTGPLDLLATDVVMPGISGRELAERLTAMRPGLKVLFLSGYTDDAVLRHGVREAETAFLQKPFTPDVLARKVRDVLDGSPARS